MKLSNNRENLIVELGGRRIVANANLVRFALDIPYTRKNGTRVSGAEIFDMRERARQAYEKKVRDSAF